MQTMRTLDVNHYPTSSEEAVSKPSIISEVHHLKILHRKDKMPCNHAHVRQFDEDILYFDSNAGRIEQPLEELPEVYEALKTGLGDYINKNGFKIFFCNIDGGFF